MFRLLWIILFLNIYILSSFSQEKDIFRVVFWNVENLFDTQKDSLKQDEEFQPSSLRGWHHGRYKKKIADIARVIAALGEWEPPALVGLCEVENDRVLHDLTRYSALKAYDYQYVMTESSDLRGIDVALLYQKDKFKLLGQQYIRPGLGSNERPTRDILHVTGYVPTMDTLDVFVVHFPSRSGGEKESEPRRLAVARTLKKAVDSLMWVRQEARILLMGDFNDYPHNKSITEILDVRMFLNGDRFMGQTEPGCLYHLLAYQTSNKNRNGITGKRHQIQSRSAHGSYKYQGEWGLLDHLMVSGLLLDSTGRFYTDLSRAEVIRFPFMLTEDEKYGGVQPFRTYNGMRYQGGYSDHLPVRVDFEYTY